MEEEREIHWPTWEMIEAWTEKGADAAFSLCFFLWWILVASALFAVSSWTISLAMMAWD